MGALVEASNVCGGAIVWFQFSGACYAAFDPLAFISLVLRHYFADAVALAEFKVSFIHVFIMKLDSAFAMPQAILELTDVDNIRNLVDLFTEAMLDSCFKLTNVGFKV